MQNKMGDLLFEFGDLTESLRSFQDSLATIGPLATAEPSNLQWQYDLGISYERISKVQLVRKNYAAALDAIRIKLDIMSRLTGADPDNVEWQRELAISYNRSGEVLLESGNLGDALDCYQRAQKALEHIVNSDPSNATWQRDLSVSLRRLGEVFDKKGDTQASIKYFFDAIIISEQLANSKSIKLEALGRSRFVLRRSRLTTKVGRAGIGSIDCS